MYRLSNRYEGAVEAVLAAGYSLPPAAFPEF
jgi:hypothetical protein